MKQISFLIIFAGMWLMGCIPVSAQKKLLGGDISLLPSYIEKGTEFRTESGRLIKRPLRFFRQQGWNALRVRLFVDPEKAPQAHKGEGVCQDLDYVIELSKDIKAELLSIPTLDVVVGGKRSPLMVAVSQTTASLYKCFSGELRKIAYPEI
jgi:hypothetical protein